MPDAQAQIAAQQEQIRELSAKVDELTTTVNRLVELFNAANGVIAAIKALGWIAGIAATVYAVFFHGGMTK